MEQNPNYVQYPEQGVEQYAHEETMCVKPRALRVHVHLSVYKIPLEGYATISKERSW